MPEMRMRLVYLTPNAAWTFLFGDTPTRFYRPDGTALPLFFESRAAALDAAAAIGLDVCPDGSIVNRYTEE